MRRSTLSLVLAVAVTVPLIGIAPAQGTTAAGGAGRAWCARDAADDLARCTAVMLDLRASALLTGRVRTAGGVAVAGLAVAATGRTGGTTARTARDGTFAVVVPRGAVRLRLAATSAQGGLPAGFVLSAAVAVPRDRSLTLTLPVATAVRVRVTRAGAPVAGAVVAASGPARPGRYVLASGVTATGTQQPGRAASDRSGTAVVRAFPTTLARVDVTSAPRGGTLQRVRLRDVTVGRAGRRLDVSLPPSTPAEPRLPSRAAVLAEASSALDRFYASNGGSTADAGWRWAAYFMGAEAVAERTGEPRYRQWISAWGARAGWTPSIAVSPTSNPDTRAALQVWAAAAGDGVRGVDLRPSDQVMAADLALPADTYWWVDSLFMGLPLWTTWSRRTGDPAYAAKGAAFYDQLLTRGTTRWRPGCTASGLYDVSTGLWWRDCRYVAARDALGHKVMWSRGNGWVMAAMARTLLQMSPDDPRRERYASMLQRMAAAVAPLQGSDGMWRTSLLSPSLYPDPETSGTALFVYAMSYGIRAGLLDRATYLPVVTRGWAGLSAVSVRDDGFTSNCQLVAEAPGPVSTTGSIAYCVGAVALAASEVSQLTD